MTLVFAKEFQSHGRVTNTAGKLDNLARYAIHTASVNLPTDAVTARF